jgi:hypothetical protein
MPEDTSVVELLDRHANWYTSDDGQMRVSPALFLAASARIRLLEALLDGPVRELFEVHVQNYVEEEDLEWIDKIHAYYQGVL